MQEDRGEASIPILDPLGSHSLAAAAEPGLLPDSLGQSPPKVDWVAELYVLNGGWLSLGGGVVERAWERGPAPVLALLLITYHQPW